MGRYIEHGIANVAAGGGFSWTPSTVDRFRVLCVAGQLVTSSSVATRQAILTVKDQSGNLLYEKAVTGTQAASLTLQYSWSSGNGPAQGGSAAVDGTIADGLPDWWMPGGSALAVTVSAVASGDQWSNLYAQVLVADDPAKLAELSLLIQEAGS